MNKDIAYIEGKRIGVAAPVIAVKRWESGYYPIYTRATAAELNASSGVTEEQAEAFLAGSMFGWDCPAARNA